MANRQTSDAVSSIAAQYLHFGQADLVSLDEAGQAALVTAIRSLAASALSQDETKGKRVTGKHPALAAPYEGSAGTDAYAMVAAVEQRNVEVTDTLMSMLAATVLSVLIDEEGGGRTNVSFSPAQMDSMHQRYEMETKRDGLLTIVSIKPRAGAFPPLMMRDPDELPGAGPAEPQAEAHVFDRPVWAIRYFDKEGNPYLAKMHDQGDAQRHLPDYASPFDVPDASIENRCCLHPDCPAERCNHVADVPEEDSGAEVTSDVDSPDA